jgi:beta-galactosidase
MIKFPLTILLLAGYLVGTAQPSTTNNRLQPFDDNWKFAPGDSADARNNNFNDASWRKLDLPHDWSIEGKPDSLNTTGNDGG